MSLEVRAAAGHPAVAVDVAVVVVVAVDVPLVA